MEFKLKRIRGKTQKTYREWYDETGDYQIRWRTEWQGITMIPAAYALVKCSHSDGSTYWGFCGKHGQYKTVKKAIEAADKNRKLWTKFFQIVESEYKGRADRYRALDQQARAGCRILAEMPQWVRDRCDQRAFSLLCPQKRRSDEDQDDPIETSETFEPALVQEDLFILASDVEDEDESPDDMSDCEILNLSPPTKPAPIVEEPKKAPKKSAAKPTKKPSKRGKKKSKATTN